MDEADRLPVGVEFFLTSNQIRLEGRIPRINERTFRIARDATVRITIDGEVQGDIVDARAETHYDISSGQDVFKAVLVFRPSRTDGPRAAAQAQAGGRVLASSGTITITLTNRPGGGLGGDSTVVRQRYPIVATDYLCDEVGDVPMPTQIDLLADEGVTAAAPAKS